MFGDCTCLRATFKALLVELGQGGPQKWVPRTQLSPDSEVQRENDQGTLIVAEWFAKKAELPGYEAAAG